MESNVENVENGPIQLLLISWLLYQSTMVDDELMASHQSSSVVGKVDCFFSILIAPFNQTNEKIANFSSELNFEKLENWKTGKLENSKTQTRNKNSYFIWKERKKAKILRQCNYFLIVCLFELSLWKETNSYQTHRWMDGWGNS